MELTDKKNATLPEAKGRRLLLPVLGITLAVAALLVLAASGTGSRLGLWHFRTGFALLKYGAWCGLAAALVSLGGAVASAGRRQFLGVILSLAGVVAGAAAFSVPLHWKMTAQRVPRIHDISTDIANPPPFVAVLPLRSGAPNPAEYGGAEIAVRQLHAYPDLKTTVLDLPSPRAFELALETARRMGWRIVAAAPGEGRIEASDTTLWFGFTDDMVVRITPAGNRSLVDIRSVSRVGISDAGTNARRIRAYLGKLAGNG